MSDDTRGTIWLIVMTIAFIVALVWGIASPTPAGGYDQGDEPCGITRC